MEVYCTLESLYILTPVLHESQLLARAFYLISTACPPQLGAQLCQTGSLGPLGDSLPLVFSFSWGSSPVGTLLHVEDLLLDARPLSPPGCLAVCSTKTYGCPGISNVRDVQARSGFGHFFNRGALALPSFLSSEDSVYFLMSLAICLKRICQYFEDFMGKNFRIYSLL